MLAKLRNLGVSRASITFD